MSDINAEIIKPASKTFRRASIKRRDAVTGKFDSEYVDITDDVKRWGKVRTSIDAANNNRIKFNNVSLKVANDTGKYNDETDSNSLWFGYANRQRSLLKIEYGFIDQTLSASGIWSNVEYPRLARWDADSWDSTLGWDEEGRSFIGVISGDQMTSGKNEIQLTARPLVQIFRDYPARKIDGWTSTGITASKFIEMLRDQTVGGEYIFRPFFGDTTGNWQIATTTVLYPNLNTSTAIDVIDSSCWKIIEKLAEAENYLPNIKSSGVFVFGPKNPTAASSYDFYGAGTPSYEFGNTIKEITSFGRSINNYYSRVQIRFDEADTDTSYYVKESALAVDGGNAPWNYGYRTFEIDNTWIANTTVAASLGDAVFDDLSAIKREMTMKTTLVPHLDVLEVVTVTYNTSQPQASAQWDQRRWAPDNEDTVLKWYSNPTDNIQLQSEEFRLLSIDVDLDKFECTFKARET